MQIKQSFISLTLGLGLTLTLLWLLGRSSAMARAQGPDGYDTYYVAPGGDCGGVTPCYADIQAAVDAVDAPGDVVKIAAGTYTQVGARSRNDITTAGIVTQVVYLDKTVTIGGGYTATHGFADPPDPEANPTTLDAGGQGRVIYVTGNISPAIEGLHITGGDAVRLGGAPPGRDAGGGVYVITATITISDSQVSGNAADLGGGLYLYSSVVTLSHSTISANKAITAGGGLFLTNNSSATLSDNQVISNTAYDVGGGLRLISHSSATLSGNTIISNTASRAGGGLHLNDSTVVLGGNMISSNAASQGGGLFLYDHSSATLSDNQVISNTAYDFGGGLRLAIHSAATLSGDTFISNTAGLGGGGLYLRQFCTTTLTNTIVADNSVITGTGAGLYINGSSSRLLHTTIARNSGGDGSGVYVTEFTDSEGAKHYSAVALTNTILVSQTVGISVAYRNTATLVATLWGADAWANDADSGGDGTIITDTVNVNVWGDPAFLNPDVGDYHIRRDSAALDAGLPAGVTDDIDGDARPFDGDRDGEAKFDIGADEFPAALTVTKQPSAVTASVGKIITYTYTLTNTGNVTLIDVKASDDQLGDIGLATDTLAPGDVITGSATRTVVAGDRPGTLVNTVTVTGKSPIGLAVTGTAQASVDVIRPCVSVPAAIFLVLLGLVLRRKR